jgi:hypothetical protein
MRRGAMRILKHILDDSSRKKAWGFSWRPWTHMKLEGIMSHTSGQVPILF